MIDNKKFLYLVLFITSFELSCTKLVEVDAPVTNTNASNVFENNNTAIAAVTDIYTNMSGKAITGDGILALSVLPGLSADELTTIASSNGSNGFQEYYSNSLLAQPTLYHFWNILYPIIFSANTCIEGLSNSMTLTTQVKNKLLGESKFIRAFCYFYLVNLYGDIPLALTTDYKENSVLTRTNKAVVYSQIIKDLLDAKSLLSEEYLDGTLMISTNERLRPTKSAAEALLARTYLYTHDWTSAESEASILINNSDKFSLVALDDVFLANSKEAIWQLQPVQEGLNSQEAQLFIIPNTGPDNGHQIFLSLELWTSFEVNDQRKHKWTAITTVKDDQDVILGEYPYVYKYKIADLNSPVSEYEMVLRLGEQYLIRAEARIQQNKVGDGIDDLNLLRSRASSESLPNEQNLIPLSKSLSKDEALLAVEHERRVELFTEWGSRWLDLNRTNRSNALLSDIKGATWDINDELYPIPLNDIQKNPNLSDKQNPGYN